MFIDSYDGIPLYLNKEVTPADCAVCVFVHGLAEHQGRYDYMAGKFHQAGVGTYRFDHRGHGRSEGERGYYSDFNDLLADVNTVVDLAIAENPERPVFLLGHSMGGFAVALYGAKYTGKRLAGIVANGALVRDNGHFLGAVPPGLDPHTPIPNELGPGVCSVKEIVEEYGRDPYNGKTFTAGLCYALGQGLDWFTDHAAEFTYPVLMTHGECDGIVSVQDTYDFFGMASSKDKQMKIYGGLLHEVYNEYCRDEPIGDAIRWIKNRAE